MPLSGIRPSLEHIGSSPAITAYRAVGNPPESMMTKSLYRFPILALQHVEAALASIERDVEAYPSMFGADEPHTLVVMVATPDADVPTMVRALLDAKLDAAVSGRSALCEDRA